MTALVRVLGSLVVFTAAAAATVAGCGGATGEYVFRDIPFCVVDDADGEAQLRHRYVLLATAQSDGDGAGPVNSWELRADAPDLTRYGYQAPGGIRMALVQCSSAGPIRHPERLGSAPGDALPYICDGQSVVVDTHLDPDEPSRRDAALGLKGVYHFPNVALPCETGRPAVGQDVTLAQIWDGLEQSVYRYRRTHDDHMPGAIPELLRATAQPELPPDPWGNAFSLDLGRRLTVTSRGPDGELGTDDDIEMLSTDGGGSRWSGSFRYHGVPEHNPDGDYLNLLRARHALD